MDYGSRQNLVDGMFSLDSRADEISKPLRAVHGRQSTRRDGKANSGSSKCKSKERTLFTHCLSWLMKYSQINSKL
ncbi:Protein of unknown function [Gryllus bimaculatus]|nr:Protein of unknown function [Gryllus bimaculatus]